MEDLKPRGAMERQFVEAIVIAFWREMRADRMEADVMSDMPPHCEDRVHGSNLIGKPENRMSMTTMLRYRAQASMDLKRALANLAAHRKVRGSVPTEDCTNELLAEVEPANENYTNELPASGEPENQDCTNELTARDSNTLPPSLTPEPTCPGEPERDESSLSEDLPIPKCTNDLSPVPVPQRPVIYRKEPVPSHHRRWW